MNEPGGAEGNDIISAWTSEDAGWIIVGITIRSGTSLLKLLGIKGGFASGGVPIKPSAAILVRVKHVTRATAPNGLAVSLKGQFVRASGSQVGVAPRWGAVSLSVNGPDGDRDVEAVHQANVVEVRLSECEFREWSGRFTRGPTFQRVAAWTGLALPLSVLVEFATGSGPNAAAPTHRGGEHLGLARF